ncbi:MAG: metalloregulator ArsR/SmtB family transcription factor [Bdellovibrionota bacterium]|nr:metalloregulator ArsR/SmtB family transcription factor [Bdellovibrionota bacterium]
MKDISLMKEMTPKVAAILKQMAHPKRLFLLCLIRDQEMSVSEIERLCGMGQSQTSQVLNQLKNQGLITDRREGKNVFYQLKDQEIAQLLHALYHIYCQDQETAHD